MHYVYCEVESNPIDEIQSWKCWPNYYLILLQNYFLAFRNLDDGPNPSFANSQCDIPSSESLISADDYV